MKEAFEKLKERLEEETLGKPTPHEFDRGINRAIQIVSEVEAEYMKNPMYQYAMVYAKNLVQFGVDVRENLDSAVAQSMALNQAYIRGIEDERKRIYEAEYGNGWIPVERALPEEATVYEVTEEIIICSKKQYIVEHRLFGTDGEWLCPSNRKVIAWMPLPEAYKGV